MRATGLVVLDEAGEVVLRKRIGWKDSCATVHQRIRYFAKVAKEVQATIASATEANGPQHQLAIAVEDYATHGPGDPTIGPELGAIVRLGLIGYPSLHEVSATSLKKFATGKGNAQKQAVMLEVYKRWEFDCGQDDNTADAYVLARMVRAAYLGDDSLNAQQVEALGKAGLGGLKQ
jgi:crossover junction endodeoxyribonuclease RuvC